jgi:hypothetical protein
MTDIPETHRCPACETLLPYGASGCAFCGVRPQGQRNSIWNSLLWLVKAYRTWSLGVFAYALIQLAMVGHPAKYFFLFLILFPFGMALGISYRMGDATSRWIVAFLILVDLGVIIAPEHQFLPFLNLFPMLPRTQNRILTWYFLVYGMLQFVVLPPVMFFRSLRAAWLGRRPALATWICCFGLAVWGLIVTILTVGLTR